MKRILLITLTLTGLFVGIEKAYAQNAKVDSLNKELKRAKEDTNKVNIFNQLSEVAGWRVGNYDTAKYYAQIAIKLAEKLGYKKGIASAYNNIGLIYNNRGDYPEALKNYFASHKIFEEIGDKKGIANNYVNIGSVYYSQGDYPEALKYYFTSLRIYEEIGNKSGIADNYIGIGIVYYYQGNYPEALKNFFSSLKIFEEIGNKYGIANNYNNIGIIYMDQRNYPEALKNFFASLEIFEKIGNKGGIAMNFNNIGLIYMNEGNYPEALKNYFGALKIYEEIGNKYGIANNYNNIGIIYSNQGNYPEALKNLFASLKIFEEIGDKSGIANIYNNIGETYTKIGDAQKGKEWLQRGLSLSKETGAKDFTKEAYLYLTSADSALGNFKSALENYKLYTIYKDSLFNEENTKKLTQSSMQYEFDKKQLADSLQNAQLRALAGEKLERQKIFTGVGAAIAFLFLGFSVVIFRNNKKLSAEKRKSEGLLLNILPEEISAELKERGAATAHEFESVTVLFTDFVNFTIAGERMSSTELVEELHHCFKAFDEIIGKYHIEKIKTVGDAYLAVSGLPQPDAEHAQHIVKAGIEIRDFMLRRRAELGDKTFEIRIGIHSGSVVAGIVGVKKFAYDIWGDTVNTAARMEQNSEVGKVNISGITYELVKDEFECTYRGKVQAKNKGEVDMYFVK